MDFKTAKEIVLALKEIAKNIQSDKSSNTDNNSGNNSNNNDDLQYLLLIDPRNDSYGTLSGTIIFKDLIENLTFEGDVSKLGYTNFPNSTESLENLGELENSEVLIKCFNKTIDVINELFNKYEQLEEFHSSYIELGIIICNQSEYRDSPFSNRINNATRPETYCYIRKNKDTGSSTLGFLNLNGFTKALCDTTTKFDENSVIYTQEN